MALSKKQQGLRAQAIGSSEIGVLAGLSRWSTPIAIYEGKVLGYEEDATLAMDLGIEFEEPIARVYAKRQQRWLARVDTLVAPKLPYAVASCDRAVYLSREDWKKDARAKAGFDELAGAEKILECKSTTWRMAHEWGVGGTDQVPEYFLAQVNWQMGVTGVRAADLAVLFDKDRFEIYHLVFSQQLFEGLYEIAGRFMVDHVEAQRPPPPDASERYAEYLSRAFPKNKPKDLISPDARVEDITILYAKLKVAQKRLEAHLKLAANQIKNTIGDHTGLISPRFGTITWKQVKDSSVFDAKAAYNDVATLAALLIQRLPEGDERAGLEQRLRGIPVEHTKTKPGYRRLHSTWTNEAVVEVASVGLAFDELQVASLGESPDDEEQSNPNEE